MFYEQPWFIIVMALAFFGLIAIITFIIYRVLNKQNPKKNPKSEEEVAKEELDRMLEDFTPEVEEKAWEEVEKEEIKLEEEQEHQE